MTELLRCPQGHEWNPADFRNQPETCPECGSDDYETVTGLDTRTSDSPIADELPPPPEFVLNDNPLLPSSSRDVSLHVASGSVAPATAPETGSRSKSLPTQFGRYKILRQLGAGAMGAVYLAHDSQLDRSVALKVPHFLDKRHPLLLERFQSEARAAAALDHPNLCSVYDVGEIEGIHYIAMAYIEGEPLSQLIRGKDHLPQDGVADLVRQLAVAMSEAHGKGVVHRDLKPANIIINLQHEPVVMDFGLARREQSDDARLTRDGAVFGTPAYMAPEQAAGETDRIDQGCDIYSLGVILYELLTGHLPYDRNLRKTQDSVEQQPTELNRFRPDTDSELESICLKAMSKKIEDRFSSMSEFASALEIYLKESTGSASLHSGTVAKQDNLIAGLSSAIDRSNSEDSQVKESVEGLATQLLAELAARFESGELKLAAAEKSTGRFSRQWLPWTAALVLLAIAVVMLVVFIKNGTAANQFVTIRFELSAVIDDPTLVVFLDGEEIPRDRLEESMLVSIGDHELVIKRENEIVESRTITVSQDIAENEIPLLMENNRNRMKSAIVDPTLAVQVKKYYDSSENSLHSSLFVNDRKLSDFQTATMQNVADYLKPGWNKIVLETSPSYPAKNSNELLFSMGPRKPKNGSGSVFSPLLWSFRNGDHWKLNNGKYTHRLDPKASKVSLTFHLYYAGLEYENRKPEEGDFILSGVPYYGSSNSSVTATVKINGTLLNSFAGQQRNLVITDLLKKGLNEIEIISKRVDNSLSRNDTWISVTRSMKYNASQGRSNLKPIVRFGALTGWTQNKQTGKLVNRNDPDSNTVRRIIPLFLRDNPKKVSQITDKSEMTAWVNRYYNSNDNNLFSEMKINGKLIGIFTSDTYEKIEDTLKKGWNTVSIRTTVNPPAHTSNHLIFRVGPTRRDVEGQLIKKRLWRFYNNGAWTFSNGEFTNALGPDKKEVALSFRLYYTGEQTENDKVSAGDYVLNGTPYRSTNPSVTSTVFINGTALDSFAGESRQVVITPFLREGKNEIRLVTSAVKNCLSDNDLHFTLIGPATYNVAKQGYESPTILKFNSLKGWVRDGKTSQLVNKSNPNRETIEQKIEFTISNLAKKK